MKLKSETVALSISILTIAGFIMGNVVAGAISANNGGNGGTSKERIINDDNNDQINSPKERIVEETEIETIAYETETIEDSSIEYGKTIVRVNGINGEKALTYKVTYVGKEKTSKKLIKEEVIKQPVTRVVVKGTKEVWHCEDRTSYDGNANNDNYCESSTGEKRYVRDCEAVKLDPTYHPGQSGASYYNGCAW